MLLFLWSIRTNNSTKIKKLCAQATNSTSISVEHNLFLRSMRTKPITCYKKDNKKWHDKIIQTNILIYHHKNSSRGSIEWFLKPLVKQLTYPLNNILILYRNINARGQLQDIILIIYFLNDEKLDEVIY